MKQKIYYIRKAISFMISAGFAATLLFFASSCDEDKVGQIPTDKNPPAGISSVIAEPMPGGAKISYDLPKETDISYVICEYLFQGEKKISRSSIYSNYITVEGLADISPCEFTLYLVDHSENRSTAYTGSFVPLEPPYRTIAKTVTMTPDFGGVVIRWTNETNVMIGAFLLAKDDQGEWDEYDLVYSTQLDEKRSIRGYNTDLRPFAVVLLDRFGNYSDTVMVMAEPLYEKMLDKSKFSDGHLQGDNFSVNSSRPISNIWDGDPSVIWHTDAAAGYVPPQTFTINLGVDAQLSRMMLWNRQGGYYFSQHNVRLFEVWGSTTLSHVWNDAYWKGEDWKDEWTLLGDFEQIKPSGLPYGQDNDEDRAATVAGQEFMFEAGAGDIHYLRFVVKETWQKTAALHIGEVSIFGDDGTRN